MLVGAAASLSALAFEGPGQADWLPGVLGDDVIGLAGHHRVDRGMTRTRGNVEGVRGHHER